MTAILLFYVAPMLITHRLIVANNVTANINPQPGSPDPRNGLSPAWALICPVFWLKTIPIFFELQREENKERHRHE